MSDYGVISLFIAVPSGPNGLQTGSHVQVADLETQITSPADPYHGSPSDFLPTSLTLNGVRCALNQQPIPHLPAPKDPGYGHYGHGGYACGAGYAVGGPLPPVRCAAMLVSRPVLSTLHVHSEALARPDPTFH